MSVAQLGCRVARCRVKPVHNLDGSVSLTKGYCKYHYRTECMRSRGKFDGSHRDYSRLKAIELRCYSKKHKNYDRYGARGISIHPEWLEGMQGARKFHEYIKSLPNYGVSGYTLDRIDNDGNYEPGNLRWSTQTTQELNKGLQKNNKSGHRGVRWVESKGKWEAYIGKSGKTIQLGRYHDLHSAVSARKEAELVFGYAAYIGAAGKYSDVV